jgi:hypothetical protein
MSATLRAFQSRTSPIYGSLGGQVVSPYMRSDDRQGYVIERDATMTDWRQQRRLPAVREFDDFCS